MKKPRWVFKEWAASKSAVLFSKGQTAEFAVVCLANSSEGRVIAVGSPRTGAHVEIWISAKGGTVRVLNREGGA